MKMTLAKDLMTTELVLGTSKMTFEEAIKILVTSRITGIPIIDENRKLLGVVSEFDVIKAVDQNTPEGAIDLKNSIRYSQKVTTIKEDTPLKAILEHFLIKKIRRLIVVNDDFSPIGVITRRDIMRALFFRAKMENLS